MSVWGTWVMLVCRRVLICMLDGLTVEEEEEEENRKTPGVSFERFRHDRKSYMKAVHRAPLLVPYERVKHVVMDNYHRDTADENKDVAYNWVQVHQNR